jgi:hypothetical protein
MKLTIEQLLGRAREIADPRHRDVLVAIARDGRLWVVLVEGALRSLEQADNEREAIGQAPGNDTDEDECGWAAFRVRLIES